MRKLASKKDPYTGEEFIPKRSNQKFGTLANKTAYNNAKAKQRVNKKKPTFDILKRNEKILAWVLGTEKERIVTKLLLGWKFGPMRPRFSGAN